MRLRSILNSGLLCLAVVLVLNACSGGASSDVPTKGSDADLHSTTQPVAANPSLVDLGDRPAADGGSLLQALDAEFTVNEDSEFAAQLSNLGGSGATYALYRGASHGTVEIQPDGNFLYVPKDNFNGADQFEFYVWDEQGGSLPATVSLRVLAVGDAPELNGDPPTSVLQGEIYRGQFFAADVDAEDLAFIATDLPAWLTLSVTGALTGVPGQQDVGLHEVTVSVVDAAGVFTHARQFTIEVVNVNDPPPRISGECIH